MEKKEEAVWITQLRSAFEQAGLLRLMQNDQVLHDAQSLFIASDYGGEDQHATYRTYAFLIIAYDNLARWFPKVQDIHKSAFGGQLRSMEFKKLDDGVKLNALSRWLEAANCLNGYLVTLSVNVQLDSIFGQPNQLELLPGILKGAGLGEWKPRVAEKLLRILHFQSVLCSFVLKDGQKIFWMTDRDSIFESQEKGRLLAASWQRVLELYLPDGVRPSKVGLAMPLESKNLSDQAFDEALTYADLSAGAVQELFSGYSKEGGRAKVQEKTAKIVQWLALKGTSLKRINVKIEGVPEDGLMKLKTQLVVFDPI